MKKIYFTHGFLGVGKTTFATKFAKEHNIIKLSIDDIMIKTFGRDIPEEKFMILFGKVEQLLQCLSLEILKTEDEIILDIGLWSRETRDKWRNFAIKNKFEYQIFNIECPEEIALQRVLDRTAKKDEKAFYIDKEKYYILKEIFNPLESDEIHKNISGINN